jgi:hypothetical protein
MMEPILIESSPEPDSDREAPPVCVTTLRRSTRLAQTQPRVDGASGRIQKLTVVSKPSRSLPAAAAIQNGLIRKCERMGNVSKTMGNLKSSYRAAGTFNMLIIF